MTRRTLVPTALALALLAAAPAALAQAKMPEIKPFEVAPLGPTPEKPTGWYGRFGMTNCAWLDMGDGVLVVDTGATAQDAANLRSEIARTTKGKPVRWIVVTHLHQDSNGGLPSFFPSDVTVYVNHTMASGVAVALGKGASPGKQATVVGVTDRLFLLFGTHPVQLFVPEGNAHTDHDLVAYAPELGTAFVGDLVTPGRCPMLSDPSADPKTWEETLDRVLKLQPAVLVATRGDAAVRPGPSAIAGALNLDNEVKTTRAYMQRVLDILKKLKKEKAPEARVSSELRLAKTGEYCPVELDAVNALALFRRITPEGTFAPPKPQPAPPKPAAKK